VGDAGASLSINDKCNKTMQMLRSSNCLQSVLHGNQINPRHLRIFSPVNCKWKLNGEIMEEFSKKYLRMICLFRFRKKFRGSTRISLCYYQKAQITFNYFVIYSSDFDSCAKFNLQWHIGWLQLLMHCRLYLKNCCKKRNCTFSKLHVSHWNS